MIQTEFVGFAAATLTTVAFIPLALKAPRHRNTGSLSLGMYVIFTTGVVLWGIYGYLRQDWAIIAANFITGSLSFAIRMAKLRNG